MAEARALDPRLRRVAQITGPAVVLLVLQALVFPMSPGYYLYGATLGLLGALMAVGMALVYRANRILNFAQGDLGLAPAVFALSLLSFWSFPYPLAALSGLVAAVLVGGVVEFVVIRRFFRAPRLILTVATIGLAQLLSVLSLIIPTWWGKDPTSQSVPAPFEFRFELGPVTYNANYLLALVVAPAALIAVAAFLRYTNVGIAVRAAAERSDRALLLGVPVKRLQTLVWIVAGVLSFLAVFLKAGMVGLPFSSNAGFGTLSFGTLLAALTALVLGRLTDLPAVGVSAVALGIVEQAVVVNNGDDPALVYPVYGVIIIVALLLQRASQSRAEVDATASWQAADEVRPVPREVRRVPEVAAARWGGLVLAAVLLVRLPAWLSDADLLKVGAVAVFAIVGLSIVVLTGWGGQVSLGQMAFAGVGAAVSAWATVTWSLDLSLSLLLAGAAGAVTAVVVGLPALRLRGLLLGVTTLAFAVTASTYLLNPRYFSWIPRSSFERPALFANIDLGDGQSAMYLVCVACLGLALLAVAGLRKSRTGRVLLAVRENERGVQAYGVNLIRAKLTGFAVSGFLAAVAGALLTQLLEGYSVASYGAQESFAVFTATVVGGLGSSTGAVLGAIFSRGGTWFLPDQWRLLPSAIGVLFVLMLYPSGLGGLWFRVRDLWLRSVARRNEIVVPSLLADIRTDDPTPLEHAEEAVEASEEAAQVGPVAGPGAETTPGGSVAGTVGANGDGATRTVRTGPSGEDAADPARPDATSPLPGGGS